MPGLLLALIAYVDARQALERAVGRHLSEVAHDALVEIEESRAEGERALHALAADEVMHDAIIGDLDKRIARALHAEVETGGRFRDLVFLDRVGRVVAASDPPLLAESLAGRPSVRAALAGRPMIADVPAAEGGGFATVETAVPVPDPERGKTTIGALFARYDWAQVLVRPDRIRRTLLAHGLTVTFLVLDAAGTVIGEVHDEAPAAPGTAATVASALGRAPHGSRRGFLRLPAAGALLGYERSQGPPGWLVAAMQPMPEAFAPIVTMQRRLTLALAGVVLVALLVATVWAARLARPLRELTEATRAMARAGEVPRAVTVRSGDEIGVLATAFNAMSRALALAREDLLAAAKFAFVGEVAAGIAHEVRTPLGIMRGSAQMLSRSIPPDYPEGSELAGMIVEEVDRLDRVVAGLLELARPRAPVFEPTALAPLLNRAIDFLEAPSRDKDICVTRALGVSIPPVRCDPDQIYQVALNLILNAIQILPRGGQIRIRTLAPAHGRVAFDVADDGPGIPPELQDRIFTPFFSAREGGTGLGLALVQRIVQAHRGTITVQSEPGRGTTFRVELPLGLGEPPVRGAA
jgi:signal transduction histidine kinase